MNNRKIIERHNKKSVAKRGRPMLLTFSVNVNRVCFFVPTRLDAPPNTEKEARYAR
ncbi:MAG: hypothetical protein QOH49_846 [Acidobacteriota bacterium]|jgi:hypothetical protein|nr:hypothetical protein [Acidobacteriota bacterium]